MNKLVHKNHALIIDDDQDIRNVLKDFFVEEFPTWSFVQTNDGSDAVKKIAKQKFELIICDLNMPKFTGKDVLLAINAKIDKEFRPNYIIMLSGHLSQDQADKLNTNPAIIFLTKPFQPAELKTLITSLFVVENAV